MDGGEERSEEEERKKREKRGERKKRSCGWMEGREERESLGSGNGGCGLP